MHRPPRALARALGRAMAVVALCLGVAGASLAAESGPPVASVPSDPVAAAVVAAARSHLGDAYRWGSAGPQTFDCSGLVYDVWRQVGGVRALPRISRDQAAFAVPLPLAQVLPGDLVLFGDPVYHVGIVSTVTITDTGTGAARTVRLIDASGSRGGVVERALWTTDHVRFGRVPRPGMPAVLPWTPGTTSGTAATVPAVPLTLPATTQLVASSPRALAAAALARKAVGEANPGDAQLIHDVWLAAGGRALATTTPALVAEGTAVPFSDARVGDLVVYAAPATHVGLYVGNGLMVDGSLHYGRVLLRAVWASPGLSLVRLPS